MMVFGKGRWLMSKQGELTKSLATVAIAALGGPLFVARAALAEVVKYAQSRYDENEQSRQVLRQVAGAVTAWASGEKLIQNDVDLGLALAAEKVACFGLSKDKLAELGFDPVRAAEAVVSAAKAEDPRWGTEDHYAAAERSIGVTYEALISQLRSSEGTTISVFLALRGSIEDRAARTEDRIRAVAIGLGDLADALAGVGTVADVMSYLRLRVANWDVSVWHHDWKASALERLVKVREEAVGSAGGQPPEEALAGAQMLVVLGGPGAGKTWLARRYARQAAQTALSQLEDGVGLDDVELPLLTTWEQWAKMSGSPTQSLVASSFASGLGHSDVDGPDSSGRLERTFLRPDARVLLVVDSLDEAADLAAQTSRLHELHGLPDRWRVVVTSRPAAWGAAYRGGTGSRNPRVVKLDDLTYPGDVEAFIRDWFTQAGDQWRGDALIKHIRSRPEVARTAVVPLMLTFYCLLAEEPTGMTTPLPARRRELYRRLSRRLLRGAWTANPAGPDSAPDWDYCEELLRGWAWAALRDRTNANGLGLSDDTFIQPTTVRQPERRSIDHVAPKIAEDYEGTITRRFVHRTFLEHFVAEHIATLETRAAADVLLPHLWFDPDWQIAAPAAIVAHNQQRKGYLLQHLVSCAFPPVADLAHEEYWELVPLLLALAQESEPHEWTQEHQDLLHRCRVENTLTRLDLVARSAHWAKSNPDVRAALLQALTKLSDPKKIAKLAGVLPGLAPTEGDLALARRKVLQTLLVRSHKLGEIDDLGKVLLPLVSAEGDRAEARTAVLQAVLGACYPSEVRDLIEILQALVPTDDERTQARTAALQAIGAGTGHPARVSTLATTVAALAPTEHERTQACTAVLQAIAGTEDPKHVHTLAETVAALATTEGERVAACTAVLHAIATKANSGQVPAHIDVLLALVPTVGERAQARRAVLQAMAGTDDPERVWLLIDVLQPLGPTDDERAQARTAVLRALAWIDNPWRFGYLLSRLPALAPTDDERAQARTAVLRAMGDTRFTRIDGLIKTLATLGPTDDERGQARTAALQAMAATKDPQYISALVNVITGLMPTQADWAAARTAVLQAMASSGNPNPSNVAALAEALPALALGDVERSQARTQLLQALVVPGSAPSDRSILARTLTALAPTDDERAQVRTAVLHAMAAMRDAWHMRFLIDTLRALAQTESDWTQARTAVLEALARARNETDVRILAEALTAMAPRDGETARARTAVLQALAKVLDYPPNYIRPVRELIDVLLPLLPTDSELMQARTLVLKEMAETNPAYKNLTKVLRSVSSPELWMAWLGDHR